MGKKIDRIGEMNINSFGSKMVISKYRNNMNIDVYFPEYDWTFENVQYSKFKNGGIKCPYEPRYYGKGYLGEVNIRLKKMVKIQMSMIYGIVCYRDVTILNFTKENLLIKIVL